VDVSLIQADVRQRVVAATREARDALLRLKTGPARSKVRYVQYTHGTTVIQRCTGYKLVLIVTLRRRSP
jgi:hypothetical protein